MIITTLVENTRLQNRPDLIAEHGLSLHIQHNDMHLLFDTGASEAFSHNAERLGVDISRVSHVILSHHHYDHGGGLKRFFECNDRAKVYLCHAPDGDCSGGAFGFVNRYIGLDHNLFVEYPERFTFVDGFKEIAPDIFLITDIENKYPKPKGNRYLYLKKNGTTVHDPFEHELIMVIRDQGQLVVITGCSHSGTLNMVYTVTQHFEGVPIKAVIGGFHLVEVPVIKTTVESRKDIETIANQLQTYPVDKVYTGHCTCQKAYNLLKHVMGDQIEHLATGGQIEI
jgi:7,8-dihydropterin-6-yl-methyl-4-(beta-D-ribofuranosyl)aminobenzene 5'-phosphate synthase